MEWVLVFVILIFIMILIYTLFRYALLKQDLKHMKEQISYIEKHNTNLVLRSVSMDKDMVAIMNAYNDLLRNLRQSSIHLYKEEQAIKNVISNISHDLRTPITSILGYTQLLEKEELEKKHMEYVSIISSKSNLMKTLVEQLFTYSIVLEQDNLTLESTNIRSILEDVIIQYYDEFSRKKMDITLELSEEDTYCIVDKLSLKRVFTNIITNALKYGENHFSIHQEGPIVVFCNESSLIDSIDTNQLFDRFFTIGSHRGNHSMGLGLTIAKQLVESMNGTISASKDGEYLTIKIELKAV